MAEFKLGRIRFVWKNNWTTSTTYYKDDVVFNGGRMYICVIGHESQANFYSDFDVVPPKWNIVSDGFQWKGDWSTGTAYIFNDIVKYGARLYVATAVHTSQASANDGLEADIGNWDVFGEGLDFKSTWSVSTKYKINDLVKYGGYSYVCITPHTSSATASLGLEADQSKWSVLNAGIEYKGNWQGSATRYKINDVVKYGASLWLATTAHSSTNNFSTDESNWTQFVQGFQFEDDWDTYKVYQKGDVVRYGGNQYVALENHTGSRPTDETDDPNNWQLFTENFRFLNAWGEDSTNQDYKVGEVVKHGGYTYLCIKDSNNNEPPDATYWTRLNSGFNWKGAWVDDSRYILGDVVRYGSSSYVCVNAHWSEGDDFSTVQVGAGGGGNENSRPDRDATGTYWNVLTVGSEAEFLTTKGDLVYYGGAGPTRLPVGSEGQVLRVSDGAIPEWSYLGATDDVYYVAPHGVDKPAPDAGRTIDKPFKTIRYACEAIENGSRVPAVARMLELNRQFITREIVEWTDYQVTNNIAPFTAAFTYAQEKCERDMGFIVDAFIYDLTHGGNVKSREAALRYVRDPGKFYALGQEAETVASINYGIALIQKVLLGEAPAVNYQTTNGDNSTAVVAQYFDTNFTSLDTLEYNGAGGSTGTALGVNASIQDPDATGSGGYGGGDNDGGGYY